RRRVVLDRFGCQRAQLPLPLQAAQIEPGGDLLDPGRERPLTAELGDPLEGGEERILRHVVRLRRRRAHAAQHAAHRRAMPAHELAEGGPLTQSGEAAELHVVEARELHMARRRHGSLFPRPRAYFLSRATAHITMNAMPMNAGNAAKPTNGNSAS